MQDLALLIDGKLVPGESEIPVINPATEEVFCFSPAASPAQLDDAVAAAGRAFPGWAATPFVIRREMLTKIADAIELDREVLAEMLTLEQGKPAVAASGEVDSTIAYIRYFATLSLAPEVIEDSDERRVELHRDPLGVVGAILPWNYPLLLLAFKLPPALLAGNTMVIKPAPTTPVATLRLGQLLAEILPPGVVNIVAGESHLGPILSAHAGLQKVTLTGSTETGKRVMASAAANLARVTLELGGNDPAIIFADVDVDRVSELVFQSAFGNSGQVCRAVKRVYVHADIYDEFCEALAQRARHTVVGDGRLPGVELGPVQNSAQFQRLQELLDDAEKSGTIMPGGRVVDGPGYIVRPTIVKDIDDDSRLVIEEQFGPILPIMPFTDVADVVRRANSGPYGLAASVWTGDSALAASVARMIIAGTVWVNKHIDRTPHLPVAGAKQSGIGVELGIQGLHEYTQIKIINASKAV